MDATLPLIITGLAAAYIISPLDFLPDVIPIIGWGDDIVAALIAVAAWMVYFVGESIMDNPWVIVAIALGIVFIFKIGRGKKRKKPVTDVAQIIRILNQQRK